MTHELLLKFNFIASHSLIGREAPHPHVWRLEVTFIGTPNGGKIIDIVEARAAVSREIEPLQDTFLNTNPQITEEARRSPTCEALCEYFWTQINHLVRSNFATKNESVRLSSIAIAIADPGEEDLGQSRLSI